MLSEEHYKFLMLAHRKYRTSTFDGGAFGVRNGYDRNRVRTLINDLGQHGCLDNDWMLSYSRITDVGVEELAEWPQRQRRLDQESGRACGRCAAPLRPHTPYCGQCGSKRKGLCFGRRWTADDRVLAVLLWSIGLICGIIFSQL